VPEEAIAEERAIYEKLPDVASKPEEVRPKIVEGMLAKRYFAETVLEDQAWIHDPGRTVGQALAEHSAEVREFVRYAVAESAE
jgi:elongation factor Ts